MPKKTKQTIEDGAKAPEFLLPTDEGEVSLNSFNGQILVLYLYPKDLTPGCTTEAVDFTAALPALKRAGAAVLGVSKDPPEKHAKFRAKHGLKIGLASDVDGEMIAAYGAWVEKTLYGRKFMGIDRSTFLIDQKGVIRQIWRKVRVPGHVEEVVAAVKALKMAGSV